MGITARETADSKDRCLNCGAQLTGPFCAQSGQRTQDPDPTFRELVAEAWDAFVSVDGKAMSSLRLLVRRPGALTRQYLMGHRARFVPPLRLYLLCSLAFFLVSAVDPPARGRQGQAVIIVDGDTTGIRGQASDSTARVRRRARDSASRAVLVRHGFAPMRGSLDSTSRLVADSLRAHEEAERFSAAPRRYPVHLVTALHLHAFAYNALTLLAV